MRTETGSGDSSYFSYSASKTKKINIAPNVARGGIRL